MKKLTLMSFMLCETNLYSHNLYFMSHTTTKAIPPKQLQIYCL
jgi:hypothetical protein